MGIFSFLKLNQKSTNNFSPDQQIVVDAALNGNEDLFISGRAGTGKSYIISYLQKRLTQCAVVATTGIAAQLINGRTLHSFCGIHPNYGVNPMAKRANGRMRRTQTLIIDEISMASAQLLDQVFERGEHAGNMPRLILVGDLLQLPPVTGEYVFESKYWKNFKQINLTTNHRQDEQEFIEALNDLRVGNYSDKLIALLKDRSCDEFPDDCTQLHGHRDTVEDINLIKLNQLSGEARMVQWDVKLNAGLTEDQLVKAFRFPQQLVIKDKARVILLNNDPMFRWCNGSTGEIIEINEREHSPFIKVQLDRGGLVNVESINEEHIDSEGNVDAIIEQFPINLGYAWTIHKSQSSTMDRVGVDLSSHFASGQTYVALSRCRTKEGLYLKGKFKLIPPHTKALQICGEI